MNKEGNALVEEFKALNERLQQLPTGAERTQQEVAVKAKMDEIGAKQRDIREFTERVRREILGSPEFAQLQALGGGVPMRGDQLPAGSFYLGPTQK